MMKSLAPEGFVIRHPNTKTNRIHRGKVVSIGPNEKWAVDGHEKLAFMGYEIYGIRDYWGKIHDYAVVPNARNEQAVEFLYLRLVSKLGGKYLSLG